MGIVNANPIVGHRLRRYTSTLIGAVEHNFYDAGVSLSAGQTGLCAQKHESAVPVKYYLARCPYLYLVSQECGKKYYRRVNATFRARRANYLDFIAGLSINVKPLPG